MALKIIYFKIDTAHLVVVPKDIASRIIFHFIVQLPSLIILPAQHFISVHMFIGYFLQNVQIIIFLIWMSCKYSVYVQYNTTKFEMI